MNQDTLPRMLTVKDVADLMSVSKTTVRRWVAAKKIRYFKLGAVTRFYREDYKDFLDVNTVEARKPRPGQKQYYM